MATKVINTILTLNDKMSKPLINTARNTKQFERELKKASYTAQKFASNTIKRMDKVAKRMAQLGVVAAGFAARAIVKQSDVYSDIQARLNLINDGQQTVAEFNKKIFDSADLARVKYQDIAGTVAKLGVVAKDAFKDNNEILKFSELLAKSFKIGGASAEEQSSAMLQLTQAMGSGRLQGDEFRSIMENAPMLAQAIAKEMGVTVGQLKDMSSEGRITSDVIKRAMFNSADDINKKFAQMPMKFSDAATKINNQIMQKLKPTFEKLSKWLNSEEGEKAINTIGDGIALIVEQTPKAVDAITRMIELTIEHREEIAKAAKIVAGFYLAAKGVQAVGGLIKGIKGIGAVAGILAGLGPAELAIVGITTAIAGVIAACVLFPEKFKEMKDEIIAASKELKDKVTENWNKLKEFFKHPIKATIEYIEKREDRIQAHQEKGQKWLEKVKGSNALGTSYWKGGWTSINERGPEMINLPNGSQVIPADRTRSITNNRGVTIETLNIVAKGVTADEVMSEVVPKLKLALANM